MKKFDSAKWITEHKQNHHINNLFLNRIAECYIEQNLPKGVLIENISSDYKFKVKNK